MRRLFIMLVSILMLLLLAGCWDRTEVNDLAIVVGMGLDTADEGQVKYSTQIIVPSAMGTAQGSGGGQGSGKTTIVKEEIGKTVFDADSKLQEKSSRKLFTGHSRVVFISEKMAEKGIRRHIDILARHPNPRLNSFVFVTKGSPVDFFNIMPALEQSTAETARELVKLKTGIEVNIKDLLQMMNAQEESATLPILKIVEEPSKETSLRIDGIAVFKHGKMVGQLDDKMTRGVLWVRNEIKDASITIKPEGAEGDISFNIFAATTTLTPTIKNGKWTITINVRSTDDAVENETTLDLMKYDTVLKLEKQLEKQIDKRIRAALDIVQKELKADILGFGKAFHRQYPDQWAKVKDNWNKKFPEVAVTINTDVKIKRPGRTTSPPAVPEDKVTNDEDI